MGLGSGIWDSRFGIRKNLFRIPDPGVKKAPDPQHCYLAHVPQAHPPPPKKKIITVKNKEKKSFSVSAANASLDMRRLFLMMS